MADTQCNPLGDLRVNVKGIKRAGVLNNLGARSLVYDATLKSTTPR